MSKPYTDAQRRTDYGMVFSGEQGQRVLADLLRACGVNHSTYVRGDLAHTAFLEGRRSIGVRLQLILKGTDTNERIEPDDAAG